MANMSDQQEVDRLLQTEWREQIIPEMHKQQWITVYQESGVGEDCSLEIRSAFVPNSKVEEILASTCWGSEIHFLDKPYMETLKESANPWADDPEDSDLPYQRFGNDEGMEPLVIARKYPGNRPQDIEILEEFRLFHNLHFDSGNSAYVKFDDCADEIEVVRIREDRVQARRKEIREFLTARKMSLAVYFDRKIRSRVSIDEDSQQTDDMDRPEKNYVYRFFLRDASQQGRPYKSFSRIRGKVIIEGVASEISSEDAGKYVEFIVGLDEDDKCLEFTCDPKILNSLKSTDASRQDLFLEMVFFRQSVLQKYYDQRSKFTVEDGSIRCLRRWHLAIDNSHEQYVVVYLGDLSDLPYCEQLYWRSFNVALPDGKMSRTNYQRSILAKITPPDNSALSFEHSYLRLQEQWKEKTGWYLLKPLSEADAHHFSKLRRPLTCEPTEFHEIVLSISILLQDRIDKKKAWKAHQEL